ncbi:nitrous oxide-stimulated promoter family protein [Lachnospiraceae bacterium LCP25S3_G4]
MRDAERKQMQDKNIVSEMIKIYCNGNHGTKGDLLCISCNALEQYARNRVACCPNAETKTFCSTCKVHCYSQEMRKKIKDVMRYSGPRVIYKHPIMVIRHVLDTMNNSKRKAVM